MYTGSAQALHEFSDAISLQTKYARVAMMHACDDDHGHGISSSTWLFRL